MLFIYAAVSKLLDFETFIIQLGQSPIVAPYANVLAILVPVTEIAIAALLLTARYRLLGLLLAFSLMVMFTSYIVIILNWSYFIPCSCGGILEKMGWTEHLIFNIVFVLLSLLAMFLIRGVVKTANKTISCIHLFSPAKRFTVLLFATFLFSVAGMFLLYLSAEESVQRNNAFQRRFPPHPLAFINDRPLAYNSYYLAGVSGSRIYLGNSTAPLHALEIDTLLQKETVLALRLQELKENKYTYLQFRVKDSGYFLTDRATSIIFRGTLGDWTAKQLNVQLPPFSSIEPMSFTSFAIKTINEQSGEDELAVLKLEGKPIVQHNPRLLTKQIDGIFDTDGILLYNEDREEIVYPYYYRNQYIIADRDAGLVARRRTIDTVSTAQISIATNNRRGESLMAERPLMINAGAATDGNLLYIKSSRLSQNDPDKILDEAVIIDVYNFTEGTYLYSFYLYNHEGQKIRSFTIRNNLLIVLTDKHIAAYRLRKDILNADLKDN